MVNCTYLAFSDVDWHKLSPTAFIATGDKSSILVNASVLFLVFSFQAISLLLSADVFIQTLTRFKRWTSLYFWSLIASATLGILYTATNVIMYLAPESVSFDGSLALYVLTTGCLPTAFALLLYSRLGTIIQQRRVARVFLKCIRILILVTFVGYVAPMVAFAVMWRRAPDNVSDDPSFRKLNAYIWYFEVYHAIEEDVLACLYVWYFYRYLSHPTTSTTPTPNKMQHRFILDVPPHLKPAFKREATITMTWLLACAGLNIIVSCFRLVIIADHFQLIQTEYFGLQYAVRLKLEFVVLNRLKAVTEAKARMLARGNLSDSVEAPTIVGESGDHTGENGEAEKGLLREGEEARRVLRDKAAVLTSEGSYASTSTRDGAEAIGDGSDEMIAGLDRLERIYLGRSPS